jgi:hypothetical protein
VPGCKATLLLDSNGEVVVEAGSRADRDRYRLIGAYQGIALITARRATDRHHAGHIGCLVCRYAEASVIVRPLRDGYYLVMSLSADANVGRGLDVSAETQKSLDAEI